MLLSQTDKEAEELARQQTPLSGTGKALRPEAHALVMEEAVTRIEAAAAPTARDTVNGSATAAQLTQPEEPAKAKARA